MPIYEYECTACGHHIEVLQRIHDAPLRTCESCNEPALKKLVSASVFRLAGKGWYETDFKTGEKRNLADAQANDSKNKGEAKSREVKSDSAKSSEVKSGNAKSQAATGQKATGGERKKPAASDRD